MLTKHSIAYKVDNFESGLFLQNSTNNHQREKKVNNNSRTNLTKKQPQSVFYSGRAPHFIIIIIRFFINYNIKSGKSQK